jgi:SAM-dependent methyltransferase
MAENNPWLNIPYTDYERHMADPGVGQLKLLNEIIAGKVKQYEPKTVAVFGSCTGNGFEHFRNTELLYAIDINPDYLEICRQRFNHYGSSLRCVAADIDGNELSITPGSVNLIICHLLLEYVDAKKALDKIGRIMSPGGTLNIVIQENRKEGFVSGTGIISLSPLSAFGKPVDEKLFIENHTFRVVGIEEYELPNGKVFKSFDLKLLPSSADA